ncbi:MAG: PQQ-binding-like beta-propeller repeat protein [Candidatus Poribacteria bacterium]|nr:PQQ-binding-like beta-propeller repeat protein [Candidatus Poribacteria bacterium]
MRGKNSLAGMVIVYALLCVWGVTANAEPRESASTEWHQWRGPNRDGISHETEILKDWPTDGPKELWRIPLGEGFSGISISNGRAYTMYVRGEDEIVVCLDASTGKEIWRYLSDYRYENRQGGDGPRSTPTVDDDKVYVLSAYGRLVALDANTGKQLWDHDFTEAFGSAIPQHGFSTSPLVEENLLLVEVGGADGKSLVAFDKASGKLIWNTEAYPSGYSSPIVITVNDIRQAIFLTGDALVSLSPKDGHVNWRYRWEPGRRDQNSVTPVFIPPDKVFISSRDEGAVVQIRWTAEEMRIEEVWRDRVLKNRFSTSVGYNGYLYGFDNTIFKCIDADTGAEQWKTRGFGQGTAIYADGHLIVLGESGNLALVEATHTGYIEIAQTQVLSGRCWTVPTLSAGRLYLRNLDELVCLDLSGEG